jgi:hypothetical protein
VIEGRHDRDRPGPQARYDRNHPEDESMTVWSKGFGTKPPPASLEDCYPRQVLVSPFIPANRSMRPSFRSNAQCPVDRLHFFFSFDLSYLRVPRKPRLG